MLQLTALRRDLQSRRRIAFFNTESACIKEQAPKENKDSDAKEVPHKLLLIREEPSRKFRDTDRKEIDRFIERTEVQTGEILRQLRKEECNRCDGGNTENLQ